MRYTALTQTRSAKTDAKTDHADLSYPEVAKSIGTFVDDPPDTTYQRAYLTALCDLFVEKYAATKRKGWIGLIQTFLEERIEDAPDETCRTLARNLWQETAEIEEE